MRQVELSSVNKDVKVVDGKLYFGEKEVRGCSFITDKTIAALYVIRVNEVSSTIGAHWAFVCGLDLIDGRIWLGGSQINMWKDQRQMSLPSAHYDSWSSVERVLNELYSDTAGKEWAVFEEEDFEAYQHQWDLVDYGD